MLCTNYIPNYASFVSLATAYFSTNQIFKCMYKLFLHPVTRGKNIEYITRQPFSNAEFKGEENRVIGGTFD